MVRFQPPINPITGEEEEEILSSSSSESESEDRTADKPTTKRTATTTKQSPNDQDEEDGDDIPAPMRGRTTRQSQHQQRTYEDEDMQGEERKEGGADMDQEADYEEEDGYDQYGMDEMKYGSRHGTQRPTTGSLSAAQQRKLALMDEVLMDEEEESFLRRPQPQPTEEETLQTTRSHFAPVLKRTRIQPPTTSALKKFIASVPPYVRPTAIDQYLPNNPLITTASASSSRSILEFHQHSYRVGWSPNGAFMFFPIGIDGLSMTQEELDPLAVDIGAQITPAPTSLANKKKLAQTSLETHLAFHTQPTPMPSAAKVFGSDSSSFTFPSPSTAQSYTPFTRLCDAYISHLNSQSSSFDSVRAPSEEVELALSTFRLLRVLYSTEEAENRAPKLSQSAEVVVRAERPSITEDLSVVTAREDPYALSVGRESAFEEGWLQPTVTASYVNQRIRQLQQQLGVEAGADGVTSTKMHQVIAYLIGHDLLQATEMCISAGNFRLATLISQLDSFNFTGRLQPDGQPIIESSQHDISRQLAFWLSKDRDMGAFIPKDIETIYRLMSGDILIEPSLHWIECLGLSYWYMQPKAEQTNIHKAMLNYKRHAFMEVRSQLRKPYPPYANYVPVHERRGPNLQPAGLEDEDDDDAAMGDGASQALVVIDSSSPIRSTMEYHDIRYGLLDLYTEQAHNINQVLSPQTHVPHVLDHSLAWHLYSTLQSTPLSQFGPHLAAFHMSYIHQLELYSALSSESSDDFWKWCIYVALAAPFPKNGPAHEFNREEIIKSILLRHITFSTERPFELATNQSNPFQLQQQDAVAPTSLPILKMDATNFFALSLIQDTSRSMDDQEGTASTTVSAVEKFLLQQCHIPSSWLYECKAISAAYQHEYSVACFYYLHSGQITEAYRIFATQLMSIWILAIINAAEQTTSAASGSSSSPLESSLFSLLKFFLPHSSTLFNWSTSGGGLILTYLEFRRNFLANLKHFTYADITSSANSLKDREQRLQHFKEYKTELQAFVEQVDRIAQTSSSTTNQFESAVPIEVTQLAYSKMSGNILQHLHALQPLEIEMVSEDEEKQQQTMTTAPPTTEINMGECVSAADRLAVLTDWKDQWLQQFS